MNLQVFLAIIAISSILTIFSIIPLQHHHQLQNAHADESPTNTEQKQKQRIVGSGESTNFNCGENTLKDGTPSTLSLCQIGDPEPPPPEGEAELSVIKTVTCESINGLPSDEPVCDAALASANFPQPSDYQLTVTGNSPDPPGFAGSSTPIVVSIGPGDYTISERLADTDALLRELHADFISTNPIFTGDCMQQTPTSATGTIAAEQSQECNIENVIVIEAGGVT